MAGIAYQLVIGITIFIITIFTITNKIHALTPSAEPCSPYSNKSSAIYNHVNRRKNYRDRKKNHIQRNRSIPTVGQHTYAVLQDALLLHKNIVAWDSFKIATMIFPLFVGTRMIDERLQNLFYNADDHKNIYYLPKQCHDFAQWAISVPIVTLGSQLIFGKTEEMRITSRIFLIGLPFVFWTKTLIKKIQFEANMRPWHEQFDYTQRSSGGFPSGHMAEATYTALLYGLRFGPRFAVPLGTLAAFIGVSFIACNRHYLSQIVAGAGLGALYGIAAHALAESKLSENLKLNVKIHNRRPAISVSYTF